MTLPKVKTMKSFFLKFDDSYFSRSKYKRWQENQFKIDPFYFKGHRIHKLSHLTFLDQKRTKGKKLKIKMLYNETVLDIDKNDKLEDLLAVKTDILLFVTGGGFVSDFEKISQYYLREIVKDNSIPIFIIKYR